MTQSWNQWLRIQLTLTEFLPKQERSQFPALCEPCEREIMNHELTHIPFTPWCTSCVKGKAQAEPHKRIERIAEDSELPIVQCDYFVKKNKTTAAFDGLKVLSMSVKLFGYGTYTVVETKGATDTLAMMESENVELPWTLRHHFAMRYRTITHQVSGKGDIQASRANSHPNVLPDDHIGATKQWTTIKNSCRDRCARCLQHFKTARNTDRPLTVH